MHAVPTLIFLAPSFLKIQVKKGRNFKTIDFRVIPFVMMNKCSKFGVNTFNTLFLVTCYIKVFARRWRRPSDHNSSTFLWNRWAKKCWQVHSNWFKLSFPWTMQYCLVLWAPNSLPLPLHALFKAQAATLVELASEYNNWCSILCLFQSLTYPIPISMITWIKVAQYS